MEEVILLSLMKHKISDILFLLLEIHVVYNSHNNY